MKTCDADPDPHWSAFRFPPTVDPDPCVEKSLHTVLKSSEIACLISKSSEIACLISEQMRHKIIFNEIIHFLHYFCNVGCGIHKIQKFSSNCDCRFNAANFSAPPLLPIQFRVIFYNIVSRESGRVPVKIRGPFRVSEISSFTFLKCLLHNPSLQIYPIVNL